MLTITNRSVLFSCKVISLGSPVLIVPQKIQSLTGFYSMREVILTIGIHCSARVFRSAMITSLYIQPEVVQKILELENFYSSKSASSKATSNCSTPSAPDCKFFPTSAIFAAEFKILGMSLMSICLSEFM